MSPSKRITRTVTVIMASVGVLAVGAGFAVGLTGWPPARAQAAPVPQPVLGIVAGSTAPVGTPVMPVAKFAGDGAPASIGTSKTIARKPGVKPKKKAPKPRPRIFWKTARASWYGPGFYGNTMAGGGTLTPSSMVVAHRTLPFGTKIQIKYRGRSTVAVVRDRGPYISGRQFDLGPGTARSLGFGGVGTIYWRVLKR